MFSLGSTVPPLRTLAVGTLSIALAALVASAPGWAQAAPPAQDVAPVLAAPAENQSPPPSAAEAPKPPVVLGELQAPAKPSANQAIRAALIRAAAEARGQPPEIRALRKAVDAAYANRSDAPVWLDKGQWTPAAQAVFQTLQTAPDDGLDLRAYRVFALGQGPEASLALADVALSEAVAAYAFQASGGRVDPSRISRLIGARAPVVPAAQALEETSGATDAGGVLKSYNPDQSAYLALRAKLAQLRASPAQIDAPQVQAPLTRLAAAEARHRASDAVTTLSPRGKAALESELLVNMEFWRWMPRDLGHDRLMVNIPEFTARLYRGDTVDLSTRVIVGKPDKATPLFSNRIEYLIINPSWNVPQSIIKNEMASKLESLRREGYDVEWKDGRLHVRQPPGEKNALGRIKFIFPNDYAVYLHDTPSRSLFAASRRAFSHGCVRVDQPFKLAVTLLGPERGWSEARLEKLLGKYERRVPLATPMPIHIGYFTLAVDENGQLRRFEDIYGYAGKARELLGLGG